MRRANTGHGAAENSSAGARKYFLLAVPSIGDMIAGGRRGRVWARSNCQLSGDISHHRVMSRVPLSPSINRKLENHNVSPNIPSVAAAVGMQMTGREIIAVPMVQIIQFNSSASVKAAVGTRLVRWCTVLPRGGPHNTDVN